MTDTTIPLEKAVEMIAVEMDDKHFSVDEAVEWVAHATGYETDVLTEALLTGG